MNWESLRFERMVHDRSGPLPQATPAQSVGSGAAGEDRCVAHRGRLVKEESEMESGSLSTMAASIKQEYITQQQDTEGGGSSATGSANCGSGTGSGHDDDKPLVQENVENYYLYNGTITVSITQLQICIDDEVMVVDEGEELGAAYLIGQTTGGSKEVRMLAEEWKLDLRSDYGPTFFLKSTGRWIQVQKPKLAYRRIMNDGLTLAHFLHFVIRHPTASAEAAREHLVEHFQQFGEQPSIEKLSLMIPVIKRQVKAHMDLEKATVLREFFPHQLNKMSFSQKVSKMNEIWERGPLHQNGFDITGEIFDEIQDKEQKSNRNKSTTSSKTPKPRRPSVQTDLRILNSQWRNLISGGGTKGIEKRPEPKTGQISRRKNPVQKKIVPPENGSPVSKSKSKPKPKPNYSRPWEQELHHQARSEPSSLELSKSPPSKKRKKVSLGMVTSVKEEDVPNFKLNGLEFNHTQKKHTKQTSSASASASGSASASASVSASEGGGKRRRRVPSMRQGVHSPSRSTFLDGLEEPPICTICDDGGDLICCDGPCRRHFHAMPGEDTSCKTLGLTLEETMTPEFICKNCTLEQHQCFICQELGSSTPSLLGPQEVYMCDALGCQKYYHAECVSKVLYLGRDVSALAERIQRGLHGFLCPRHCCAVCKSREIPNGIFVQCRRCPNAWHRECLTDFEASGELPTTSIWRHNDREFIYCKEHKILEHLQTPAQDHVKFPEY